MSSVLSAIDEPIFLVGAERSGTTVLRLMLDHHPELTWCIEFEYAVDQVSEQGHLPALETYHEWLETHRIFQACNFEIDPHLDYSQLVKSFLAQQASRTHKKIVGATVHRYFDRLLIIWPNARFIHIVRDARDVARSCVSMGWAGNVWAGVERWIEAEQLWSCTKQTIPAEQRLEITYESLIAEPRKILQQVCSFINVPYNEQMLKYPESTSYGLPDPRLIEQWKRKLTAREIQLIEARTAAMLIERGYELSDLPKLDTTAIKTRLKLEGWLRRKLFQLKRYGFPLLVSNFASRRSGLKGWRKQVQMQLNIVDNAYLK